VLVSKVLVLPHNKQTNWQPGESHVWHMCSHVSSEHKNGSTSSKHKLKVETGRFAKRVEEELD
jgi:hypothetical protein